MCRISLVVLALLVSLPAAALPSTSVNSAVGEADVRNATAPEDWMPQLPANPVFREGVGAARDRSLTALGIAAAWHSVDATMLRRGDIQLVFADEHRNVSTEASFLTAGP